MSLDRFAAAAQDVLAELDEPGRPLAQLADDGWSQEVAVSGSTADDLRALGSVELRGAISAALRLGRGSQPPDDLQSFQVTPDDSGQALASVVIAAEGGASLRGETDLPSGIGAGFGAEAAAFLAFAQHRRASTDTTQLAALEGLVGGLRNPYSLDTLAGLGEDDLFQVQIRGSADFTATAEWSTALVRALDGSDLEELIPGPLGGVKAGVKLAATVEVGVEGDFRLLVSRSPEPGKDVRLKLHRRTGSFVGAGLKLSAEARLSEPDKLVDSLLARVLEVPDGWVGELQALRGRLAEIEQRIRQLGDEAAERLLGAANRAGEELGADDLLALRERGEELPQPVREALAPLDQQLAAVEEALQRWRSELTRLVDETVATAQRPLAGLGEKVDRWLQAYAELRERLQSTLLEHARRGISVEMEAAINRSRTSEALLELDFEIPSTGLLCLEAMKGNFKPALERARTPGATGVEIVSGTLKETIKKERTLALRLDFFGFTFSSDFQRGDEVAFEEDAMTGTVSVFGTASGKLVQASRRRRNEIEFAFDVYGAAERRGDAVFATAETGFKARLHRVGEATGRAQIDFLVAAHTAATHTLGLVDAARARQIADALSASDATPYRWQVDLAFPASAVPRMLELDFAGDAKQLERRLWEDMTWAVRQLDVPIPIANRAAPLSAFFTPSAVALVKRRGRSLVPRRDPVPAELRSIRSGGQAFLEGAYWAAWTYLLDAADFIAAYLRARADLLAGVELRQVSKRLAKLSAETSRGPGMFGTPFDAKYLVFARAEGFREAELSLTLGRGPADAPEVSITL